MSRTAAGIPISATIVSPHKPRPGNSKCPGFLRKKVTVRIAVGAMPRTAPVAPSTPLGTSTATTASRRATTPAITSRATPSIGRERPAPNSASMTRLVSAGRSGARGSTGRFQRAACRAASPRSLSRSPSRKRRSGQPRSARWRAATNPSPPLLPGPQSTATGRGDQRSAIAAATAAPARSISVSPETPPAIARRSASAISCGVSKARSFAETVTSRPALLGLDPVAVDPELSAMRKKDRRRSSARSRVAGAMLDGTAIDAVRPRPWWRV